MKIIQALIFIAITFSASAIGSFFTSADSDWYQNLIKPSFNPPSWVFGPVWTTLYVMMGISVYLIYQKRGESSLAMTTLIIFFVHLIFNATWSIAFFGMQNPALAFVNIIILLIFIITLIFLFYKVNKVASYLLIPYLFWVSFATILNYSIWQLN